ncbi:MAG: EboA domain-containing protein [Verrucomicrobiae bacterium]|nr:EboA domain-containing protein [Verrucomicrobiae bacterium]
MRELLTDILSSSSPSEATAWLREKLDEQEANFSKRPFYYAFSGVSRHFPKRSRLEVGEEQAAALHEQVPGFSLEHWDLFRLARVLLLLVLAKQEKAIFVETILALLNTADLREQAAIYSAYSLLPHQEDLVESAVDGLRSNIVDVFDSIALNNPFPAVHFTDAAWNQMVLKAIFISRPLYRITGLDSRRNGELAAAISYLAHERWAAGRRIPAEAWRNCVGFVSDEVSSDLHHLLETGEPSDREAAALILATDADPRLADLRGRLEGEIDAIGAGTLSWDRLGEKLEFPVTLNGSPAGV